MPVLGTPFGLLCCCKHLLAEQGLHGTLSGQLENEQESLASAVFHARAKSVVRQTVDSLLLHTETVMATRGVD